MSALKGTAVITGAAGIVVASVVAGGTYSLTGKGHNQSAAHERTADHKFLKSGGGDSVADYITDKRQVFSLSVVPFHATALDTLLETYDLWKIPAGSKISLTDSDGSIVDGDYLLMNSKENRSNDGFLVLDLEMTKWDDNNLTAIPA